MKKQLLPLIFLIYSIPGLLSAQGGTWVWMNGSQADNVLQSTAATQGHPSPFNTPRGLYEAATWTDLAGNFWLFGGVPNVGFGSNDLWKYNPVTAEWTWVSGPGFVNQPGVYGVQGLPSYSNIPPARGFGSITWTDQNGDLWLFGGSSWNGNGLYGRYNDLWRYNIEYAQWTWMAGTDTPNQSATYGSIGVPDANNMPTGRDETNCGWVDANNNLWLFGGFDSITDRLNDMWMYNINTNMWAWMKGARNANDSGSHGILGVEAPTNNPAGRACYAHWKDSLGNFYIYAGQDARGLDDDVWKFNPISNNWTWVAGARRDNDTGDFRYPCQWKGQPEARTENRTPTSFGCTNNFIAYWYDIWMFNSDSLKWKMLRQGNETVHYGLKGMPSPQNYPPGRSGSAAWLDKNSNLWIFGGMGGNASNSAGRYNDMWKFIPDASCAGVSPFTGNIHYQLQQNVICQGNSTRVTVSIPYTQIYPPDNVSWIDSTHALLSPSVTTIYQIIGSTVCVGNDTTSFLLTVNQPGTVNYLLSDSALCQGASATLTILNEANVQISPASSVSWIDSADALLTPTADITYTVTGRSTQCGSSDQVQISIPVDQQDAISVSIHNDTVMCAGGSIWANLTGLNNVQVFATYTPNGGSAVNILSSTQLQFTPTQTDTFFLSGYSNCGNFYNATIVIAVDTPGVLDYNLQRRELCIGDSSLLTITNCNSATITPTTGVRWINATSAMLKPDTNTVYHVVGMAANTTCGNIDSANINIRVIQPGQVNYSLSRPIACRGATDTIFVYGLKNVAINPSRPIVYIDSVNSYIPFSIVNTSNFTITGQSICGQRDSTVITIPESNGQFASLSNNYVCVGDSATFTLGQGVLNFQITPQTFVTRVDSLHILVRPDTTTTYTLTGETCQGNQNVQFTVYVDRPGIVNYTFPTSPYYCQGGGQFLYTEGLLTPTTSPVLIPHMYNTLKYSFFIPYDSTRTYTICGQSVCGSWDTMRLAINVLPSPAYSLGKTEICMGDSTRLTINGLYNLKISPANYAAWIDSNPQLSHVYLFPDTTTTYFVTGTGCTGNADTLHFKVSTFARGMVYYTLGDTLACEGYYINLSVAGVTSAHLTPGNYNWTWPDSNDARTYIYPGLNPGVYHYTLTVQSVCGETDSTKFNITDLPRPTFQPGQTIFCREDSVVFPLTGYTHAAIAPVSGVTWIDSIHVKLKPDTTTNYVFTGTTCQGNVHLSFNVIVIQPGIVNYTVADTVLCPGDSTLLTIYGLSNSSAVQVFPFVQLGFTGSAEQLAYLAPTLTTTYRVTGTSICGGNDTTHITVHIPPAPSYTFNQQGLCMGDSGTVAFTGLTNIVFTPDNNVNWADSTHAVLKPDTTTVYQFSGNTTCNSTYSGLVTVTVNQRTATISGDSLICHGDSTRLCATPGFATYSWTTGQTSACIETAVAATYQVTVTDTGGCTAVSNVIQVFEFGRPHVSISLIGGDTLTGSTASLYQWFLNGQAISGATSITYIEHASGTYSLQITDSNGCTAVSKPIVITGLNELTENSISVYPNPTNNTWQLTVGDNLIGAQYEIFDITGQIIRKSIIQNRLSVIEIDVASGVYLLRIISGSTAYGVKLVKL